MYFVHILICEMRTPVNLNKKYYYGNSIISHDELLSTLSRGTICGKQQMSQAAFSSRNDERVFWPENNKIWVAAFWNRRRKVHEITWKTMCVRPGALSKYFRIEWPTIGRGFINSHDTALFQWRQRTTTCDAPLGRDDRAYAFMQKYIERKTKTKKTNKFNKTWDTIIYIHTTLYVYLRMYVNDHSIRLLCGEYRTTNHIRVGRGRLVVYVITKNLIEIVLMRNCGQPTHTHI